MNPTDEDYYNTLIDWFREPESVEKYLKAAVKAYALNKDQLQSLIGCAEEALEYLNGKEAHSMGYEIFEGVKDSVRESMYLLQEYKEMEQEYFLYG
jgi:hypothetical protein